MIADDIKEGRTYEAKVPKRNQRGEVNDRRVSWIDSGRTIVQFSFPTVSILRRYRTVSMVDFMVWVGKDVTELMPARGWRHHAEAGT